MHRPVLLQEEPLLPHGRPASSGWKRRLFSTKSRFSGSEDCVLTIGRTASPGEKRGFSGTKNAFSR